MTYTPAQYALNRDALLQRSAATLLAAERFVAAWLTGSFGRGEYDCLLWLQQRHLLGAAKRETSARGRGVEVSAHRFSPGGHAAGTGGDGEAALPGAAGDHAQGGRAGWLCARKSYGSD